MDYPMRTLAYLCEMIHPPKAHTSQDLQRFHTAAFQDSACLYQNFQLHPGGATLSNPPTAQNQISALTIIGDRIQLREELTGIAREEFQAKLTRATALAFEVLGVGQIPVQNFVVRSLVNPRNFYDSREFVARSLFNMEEEDFNCLQRKPEILGLRFVFPQTSDNRGVFNIRVESYATEPRSLFIENVGMFKSLVTAGNVEDLTSNFFATYDYIDGQLIDFIAQFDGKEQPPSP